MDFPANVIPLRCADRDGPDSDALRLDPDKIPSIKVDTGARGGRQRLFVPSTAWPELAAVVSAGVLGRSVGLWLAIRVQAKLERGEPARRRVGPSGSRLRLLHPVTRAERLDCCGACAKRVRFYRSLNCLSWPLGMRTDHVPGAPGICRIRLWAADFGP